MKMELESRFRLLFYGEMVLPTVLNIEGAQSSLGQYSGDLRMIP